MVILRLMFVLRVASGGHFFFFRLEGLKSQWFLRRRTVLWGFCWMSFYGGVRNTVATKGCLVDVVR